jgi:acetyl-CoA synthetase
MVGALKEQVRHAIGPIATPDRIVIVSGLPKTRSGKILRRMLRKIASGELDNLGDTTTLADPSVLDELLAQQKPVAQPRS